VLQGVPGCWSALRTYANTAGKGPYNSAKVPCFSKKKPYISTKEPYIFTKEPYNPDQKPCIFVKDPHMSAKKPYISAPWTAAPAAAAVRRGHKLQERESE